jgi:two-component system, cell cycle response regulator
VAFRADSGAAPPRRSSGNFSQKSAGSADKESEVTVLLDRHSSQDETHEFALPCKTKTRVLAAEDNPVFQTMLRSMLLKWNFDPVIADNGLEALTMLQAEDSPQLVILDWMMPGLDGIEVCRRIRTEGREPYRYILLLTARTEAHDLVEGMEAGADDYLTKPFNSHELRVRLRAGQRILELQEQLLQAREALRAQATHDGLTGILNRTAVLETLDRELERSFRERHPVSLLIADLDRFKSINDTYGHLAGDYVLREAARRMTAALRSYDTVGRYGGEEFLIILAGSDSETARSQAERIRLSLAKEPFVIGNERVSVTCSVGFSTHRGGSRSRADDLVKRADLALYESKNAGRNRVQFRAELADINSANTGQTQIVLALY